MVTVAGVGMGNKNQITYEVTETIENSQTLIGSERILKSFIKSDIEKIDISTGIEKIVEYINNNYNKKNITVLAAGDVGVYSIADTLKQRLNKDINIKFLCGISSIQYFCSKIKISWHDMAIVSLHGREQSLATIVRKNKKTFVLTGGSNSIEYILDQLYKNNMTELELYIGENLSYDDEKITKGKIIDLKQNKYSSLSVIVIINPFVDNNIRMGIPDLHFIRGNVPMTKEEVRAVSINKLQLSSNHIVYDIGAGTGSVSIECALHSKLVYAIEQNLEAIELIKLNQKKFGLDNIKIIEGKAPYILEELPPPDRVFIGGSNGNMRSILEAVTKKNPKVKITINAIILETVNETIDSLEQLGYNDIDIVQISVSKAKKISRGNMLIAQNPVFIITTNL